MTDFHLEAIAEADIQKRKREIVATQQTVARGGVSEDENLVLGPRMYYKGDMVMYATKPALQLKGYAKLDLKKPANYNTWLVYEQSGDEQDIYIKFDNAITEEGRRANAGIHFAQDNRL